MNLGEAFSESLLLSSIKEGCVYLEMQSKNQNNKTQIKNKFKLCLSNKNIQNVINGMIFCSSCSNHIYLQNGRDHVSVVGSDYEECLSENLRENTSIYIPNYVEFIQKELIVAKKRANKFLYKAKLKENKFIEIRKMVRRRICNLGLTCSDSVMQLRKAIGGIVPDTTALERHGVNIDKTFLSD